MQPAIHVKFEYSDNIMTIRKWFNGLDNVFAADFETAPKQTRKEREVLAYRLDHRRLTPEQTRIILQQYLANGLSHPSLTVVTHLSIACAEDEAKVIVCSNDAVRKVVFDFLTTTEKKQIWHNCAFDFKHIFHNTHRFPKNFIDTMLLCRVLLNNANGAKNEVGLKTLMGYAYGSWAVAKDSFVLEEMWDEKMLQYAAVDSAATYKLYKDITSEVGSEPA